MTANSYLKASEWHLNSIFSKFAFGKIVFSIGRPSAFQPCISGSKSTLHTVRWSNPLGASGQFTAILYIVHTVQLHRYWNTELQNNASDRDCWFINRARYVSQNETRSQGLCDKNRVLDACFSEWAIRTKIGLVGPRYKRVLEIILYS